MSESCNKIDRAKNPQLDAICACKDASDAIVKEVAAFQIARTQYDSDYSEHERKKESWSQQKNLHETQKIDQKNYLINEKKYSNNPVDANLADGNRICNDDFGGGWYKTGWEGNYGIFGALRKVICQRNTDKVNSDLLAWEKNNPAPIEPVFSKAAPNSVSNTLQCCSQNFSNISTTTGALSFSGIVQNCNQEINTKIDNLLATPTPSSITSTPVTTSSSKPTPTPDQSKVNIKLLIIFAIVFIIFLFFLLLLI